MMTEKKKQDEHFHGDDKICKFFLVGEALNCLTNKIKILK